MASQRSLSASSLYSAQPIVHVDGKANLRTARLLEAMNMVEHEGGMSSLELRYSALASHGDGKASLAFEDDSLLRLGARITVYAGDQEDPREIFRGRITGLELELATGEGPQLVVLAEDALQRARMERRTSLHKDVTLAQLARTIAQRLGLKPVVRGLDRSIGTQVQLNESDLAFLRRLLIRNDGDLLVVGEELHVFSRGEARRDLLRLVMFDDLSRARVTADLAHQVTEVTVSGWDPQQAQRIRQTSRGKSLGPGSGRTGARLLEDTLGKRSEHVGHVGVQDDAEARALAEAAFDQRARRFVLLEGSTEGNPDVRVGTHVEIVGLGARFDNTYYVRKALHRFDQKLGYMTDFEAECGYLGEP